MQGRFWRVPAVVLVAAALAGCSGSVYTATTAPTATGVAPSSSPASTSFVVATSQPNPAQQVLTGYLAHASNGVVFLQWTRSADTLTGALTQAYTAPGDPTALKHDSATFTGVLSGGSVTLNFPQGLGTSTTWSGTLNGDTLIMSFAAADGSLQTLTFTPGTVADYNTALAQVQAEVGQAQATAQAAQQAQQAAQQLQQEQHAIDQDAQQVQSDLAAVPQAVSQLPLDVAHVPSDLSQEAADVQTTYQDEQTTLTAAANASSDVCGDANTTQGDANTVQGDENTVNGDGNTINGDIDSVQAAVSELQNAFKDLAAAEAVLPSYQPAGLPTAQDVATPISAANTAIASARKTYAGYLAQAKAMVATANQYAAAAAAACH